MFAGLYAVAAFTSYRKGRTPQRPLLHFVRPERYYLWESVFIAPVTFAWMTLFARLVRRAARRVGGSGTYESDFNILAMAHTVPLIVAMWLPDMACYLSGVEERRYQRLVTLYAPAATAWAVALCVIGIQEAERISPRDAAIAVVIADLTSAAASGVPIVMR